MRSNEDGFGLKRLQPQHGPPKQQVPMLVPKKGSAEKIHEKNHIQCGVLDVKLKPMNTTGEAMLKLSYS
jgi:hypothetical protein